MKKDYLDERSTTVGEGQYEHTSWPTLSPVFSSPLSFFCIFHFLALYFPFLQASPRSTFQIETEIDLSLDLSFLDQLTYAPNPQCVLLVT